MRILSAPSLASKIIIASISKVSESLKSEPSIELRELKRGLECDCCLNCRISLGAPPFALLGSTARFCISRAF